MGAIFFFFFFGGGGGGCKPGTYRWVNARKKKRGKPFVNALEMSFLQWRLSWYVSVTMPCYSSIIRKTLMVFAVFIGGQEQWQGGCVEPQPEWEDRQSGQHCHTGHCNHASDIPWPSVTNKRSASCTATSPTEMFFTRYFRHFFYFWPYGDYDYLWVNIDRNMWHISLASTIAALFYFVIFSSLLISCLLSFQSKIYCDHS